MRKGTVFLLLLAILFIMPSISYSSSFVGTLSDHVELSDLIIRGEIVSADIGVSDVSKTRKVVNTVIKVKEIEKNSLNQVVTVGENFSFITFAPARVIKGNEYLLFMRKLLTKNPSFVIFEYTIGDQSVFSVKENMIENRMKNKGLMTNMKRNYSGPNVERLGVRSMTTKEDEAVRLMRGPVGLDEIRPLIKRIEDVNRLRKRDEEVIKSRESAKTREERRIRKDIEAEKILEREGVKIEVRDEN